MMRLYDIPYMDLTGPDCKYICFILSSEFNAYQYELNLYFSTVKRYPIFH